MTNRSPQQTANNQATPSIPLLSDWNAVEQLLHQSVSQNPQPLLVDTPFNSFDPATNVAQAQADLLALLDGFTQGNSAAPFLLELVQVWSLSPSCDMSLPINQRNLRLILNLASYLTEIREAYNNYAFFV